MGKGATSIMVTVTFFLIAVLVIFVALGPLYEYMFEKGKLEKCRASVVAASKAQIGGKSYTSISCPAVEVQIGEDKAFSDGDLDEEGIKSTFAEEMRDCWYKMGEGEIQPFSKDDFTDKNVCVICSEVRFKDQVRRRSENDRIEGFKEYLNVTLMPGSNKTYSDYLSHKLKAGEKRIFWIPYSTPEEETLRSRDYLSLGEDYLVIYSLRLGEAIGNLPKIGGIVGGIFEKEELAPVIFLTSTDDIGKLKCDDVIR